ncbi:MAG: chitobiase/beta-hexosaminidase C-terminal domain-containing protein [Candidatus Aenigmarchaeota archaeon]|nr:chitobiase/beta-hexosaminidase C-terminal domain-containing protein [Candidatus Aenigmarchaeota archaeon]
MKKLGFLILASLIFTFLLVNSSNASTTWKECNQEASDKLQNVGGINYYCCATNDVYGWETSSDKCIPSITATPILPSNPTDKDSIVIRVEAKDDESGVGSITLYVYDKDGAVFPNKENGDNQATFSPNQKSVGKDFAIGKLKAGDYSFTITLQDYANPPFVRTMEKYSFQVLKSNSVITWGSTLKERLSSDTVLSVNINGNVKTLTYKFMDYVDGYFSAPISFPYGSDSGSFTITVGAGKNCRTQNDIGTIDKRCRVQVQADDNTPINASFYIDYTPPTTTLSLENHGSFQVITLNCKDAVSGCSSTLYCTDKNNACAPNQKYTGPIPVSGGNYIRYYSTDVAGNSETIASYGVSTGSGTNTGGTTGGTTAPGGGTMQQQNPQSPYINSFTFSGDKSGFDVLWQAFYPTQTMQSMNVECGLNCDPRTQNCAQIAGEGCNPYPYQHGTESVKSGQCRILSPSYNFASGSSNKIMCLFYDPANKQQYNTFTSYDFTPIDFSLLSSNQIIATVGSTTELKVSIANRGTLTDSYSVSVVADNPGTLQISPVAFTTDGISSNQATSAEFQIRPLVDNNRITITVTSTTNPSLTQTIVMDVKSGLFQLPDFGLAGFIQIIIIAALLYLVVGKDFVKFNRTKKRR